MRTVKLYGERMTNNEAAHRYIQEQLEIPSYYGYNLDALYDALSVYDKDLSIMLINKPELIAHLGPYGERLVQTFMDVEKVNRNIKVKVI
ncbi:ribonuclease inhibitor [Alkalibacterium subtropicum]|uniref:Ribonuclease inhibitor n=1 Tax=Alkalibacterium subtropicum TaxID=753702 RepID=A0A1I1GDK6_9LACT|nr:barstar family protein [Alkalibacterium subtropicum]SFC09624.1 ribonuclease inhibitor [Alkalibacterium subtropicum]